MRSSVRTHTWRNLHEKRPPTPKMWRAQHDPVFGTVSAAANPCRKHSCSRRCWIGPSLPGAAGAEITTALKLQRLPLLGSSTGITLEHGRADRAADRTEDRVNDDPGENNSDHYQRR